MPDLQGRGTSRVSVVSPTPDKEHEEIGKKLQNIMAPKRADLGIPQWRGGASSASPTTPTNHNDIAAQLDRLSGKYKKT